MIQARTLFAMVLISSAMPPSLLAQKSDERVRFQQGGNTIFFDRLTVPEEDRDRLPSGAHSLMRDDTHYGQCYVDAKFRRMPTTYYHPKGPLGLAMAKFDWFPGPANTYHADARMPASLLGLGSPLGQTSLPLSQLTSLWSEPPLAVISLHSGTVAAYARPFQALDIYELSRDLIDLHELAGKDAFLHFLPDARARGTQVRIFHGPPRQQLRERGPSRYYKLILMEACSGERNEKIFVDLFTKEGIAEVMKHLADDGVLCVHTSHRFLELPIALATIGKELNLFVRCGMDMAPGSVRRGPRRAEDLAEIGHFTSEWVMLSRRKEVLDEICHPPAGHEELIKQQQEEERQRFGKAFDIQKYWFEPKTHKYLWTDKGPNLLHGVLRGHPARMGYLRLMSHFTEPLFEGAQMLGLDRRVLFSLSRLASMTPAMEDWYVEWQLRNHPRVEELWDR